MRPDESVKSAVPVADANSGDGAARAARAFPPRDWCVRGADRPADACIHTLFEDWAARTPEALAVVEGVRRLTYAELNRRANQLAHFLRARGVGAGTPVGICTERSLELVIGQLGILKAGGAYVPVDAAYPAGRVAYMLGDAGVRLLLTQRSTRASLPPLGCEGICLEDDWPAIAAASAENLPNVTTPAQAAYLIYTSGSTGRPKGVVIPHRATVRFTQGQDYLVFGPADRFLVVASPAFDAIVFETWVPLTNGASCVIFPDRWPGLPELEAVIRAGGATCTFLTTSLFNQIVDLRPQVLGTLREIVVGGEALSVAHIRRVRTLLPSVNLINAYGPTECTTFATIYRIPAPEAWGCDTVPIGRPIENTECHVVDEHGRPAAIGETGELLLGGPRVADGYLNQPQLTAEKFVAHPWSDDPAARLYRTGDLCRWLPNGLLEYLGRADEQVKLRGHRIELGEIDAALRALPEIVDATTIARDLGDGRKQLVGFVVLRAGAMFDEAALLRQLRMRLPEPFVPGRLEPVEAIPLTTSGKADRRALAARLPAPASVLAETTGAGDAAQRLTRLCRRLLRRPELGADADFFHAGGDSLLAVELALELQRELGRPVPVGTIFAHPTPAALAKILAGETSALALQGEGPGAPLFYVPELHGFGRLSPLLVNRLHGRRRYYEGFQFPGVDGLAAPCERVEDIAEALIAQLEAVQPAGSVCLYGFSFGGLVAFEMAIRLRARGRAVEHVILGDTVPASETPWRGPVARQIMRGIDLLRPPWSESPRKLGEWVGSLRNAVLRIQPPPTPGPVGSAVELACLRAFQAYVPPLHRGRVSLVMCRPDPYSPFVRPPPRADYGWRRRVDGPFCVHRLACEHVEIFGEEGSALISRLLEAP